MSRSNLELHNSAKDSALELFRALDISDAPGIGVFLVGPEGTFWVCDMLAREQLGIPIETTDADLQQYNIERFHAGKFGAHSLLEQVQRAEKTGGPIPRLHVKLQTPSGLASVQLYCASLRNEETESPVGYYGCIVGAVPDERYNNILRMLTAALISFHSSSQCTRIGSHISGVLGWSLSGDRSPTLRDLVSDPAEIKRLLANSPAQARIVNRECHLLTSNGHEVDARLTVYPIEHDSGEVALECICFDRDEFRRFETELNALNLGAYVVATNKSNEIVIYCDQRFATILGYDRPDEVIGRNIFDLNMMHTQYSDFKRELRRHADAGATLVGHELSLVTKKGVPFTAEVSCDVLRDPDGSLRLTSDGELFGRVGVIKDITADQLVRQQLDWFINDVGNVLHTYTTTLAAVALSIRSVMRYLNSNNRRETPSSQLRSDFDAGVQKLASRLEALFTLRDNSTRRRGALRDEHWEKLETHLEMLLGYEELIPIAEFRAPTLRDQALSVIEILNNVRGGFLPREPIRELRWLATEVGSLGCAMTLDTALNTIIGVDYQVSALRDFLSHGMRVRDSMSVTHMSQLTRHAVSSVVEFANSKGVSIKQEQAGIDGRVRVSERDMTRALANIIHNAIKYSWKSSRTRERFVSVKTRLSRSDNRIVVSVQNFGVAIPEDEVSSGRLFELGYRGRLSFDRGRPGTGVGLTDAFRVVQMHRGTIDIVSRPAEPGAALDDYSGPFITTFHVALPTIDHGSESQ